MKRVLSIVVVAVLALAVWRATRNGPQVSDALDPTTPEVIADAGAVRSVIDEADTNTDAAPAPGRPLGLPPGAAAIPQRPRDGDDAQSSPDGRSRPQPASHTTRAPATAESTQAPGSEAPPRSTSGAIPNRELMADSEVVEDLYQSFPDLVACHRTLIELEPDTPTELTFRFELVVSHQTGGSHGVPALQSVTAGDLSVEDTTCFAEVFEELRVPQPDSGAPYATALQVSLRTETE